MRRHFGRLRVLIRLALLCERLNFRGAAIEVGSIAARYAWYRHAGVFRLPEVEAMWRRLAPPGTTRDAGRSKTETVARVLHVLSATFDTGGHNEIAKQWVEADRRTSGIFVTSQPRDRRADWLRLTSATQQTVRFDDEPIDDRVAQLRSVIREADFAVLHIDPSDPIPAMALVDGGPPCIYVNHADHVCWPALSATLLVNLRPEASRLATERRGLSEGILLPIPLGGAIALPSRAAARNALGIPDDVTLLLSVGSEYKFAGGEHFLRLLQRFIDDHERAHAIIVGPSASGPWISASHRTHGRIRAVGLQADVSLYMAAADIYLDPFPVGSLTALLKAACAGLPTLSRCDSRNADTVLAVDDPGLLGHLVTTSDESWNESLRRLARAPDERESRGRANADGVKEAHVAGWANRLEDVYRIATRGGMRPSSGSAVPRDELLDRRLATLHLGVPIFGDPTALLHRRSAAGGRRARILALLLLVALEPGARWRSFKGSMKLFVRGRLARRSPA